MNAITVIAIYVFVGNVSANSKAQCQSGGTNYKNKKYPVLDCDCYSQDVDVDHRTPYPGDCQSYFDCDPVKCTWCQKNCGDGKYWNNVEGRCVQPELADCGGALFWSGAHVQIWNVEFDKVLDDCRDCGGDDKMDQTPVIGFARNNRPDWYQDLVAKRRGNSQYYSLAFDIKDVNKVKAIQDIGREKVFSQELLSARPRPSEWRFVPIAGKKNKILILSAATGKAMAIIRDDDDRHYYVRVTKNVNPEDKKQQWIVKDLNQSPITFIYE